MTVSDVTAARSKGFIGSRPLRPGVSGSVALEYGLLLPVLLLLVFMIIDAGHLLWIQTTLDRAVEAAARCGAIDQNNCGTASKIKSYAVDQAYGISATSNAFVPETAACGMRVSANYVFTPSVAFLGAGTILLTATACYPIPIPS